MTMSGKLPSDDVGATLKRTDGVRGQRYGEIILVGSDPGTGRQVGSVYNTTGPNDPTGTGDIARRAFGTGSTSTSSRRSTTSSARSRTGRGCGAWTG
jgi:hypothetical protein